MRRDDASAISINKYVLNSREKGESATNKWCGVGKKVMVRANFRNGGNM